MPTANPEIVRLAALAEYAKRPFLVTPTQQGAPWCVATAPLTSVTRPLEPRVYDDALPVAASETISSFRNPNANPNGLMPAPAGAWGVGPLATPSGPTAYTSMRFVFFSVTTSHRPSGLNVTWAGSAAAPLSGRVDPGMDASAPSDPTVNPLTFPLPPPLRTYTRLS